MLVAHTAQLARSLPPLKRVLACRLACFAPLKHILACGFIMLTMLTMNDLGDPESFLDVCTNTKQTSSKQVEV